VHSAYQVAVIHINPKMLMSAHPMLFQVKKVVARMLIKIRLHRRVPYNKLFKIRPHMDILIKNFNEHLSHDEYVFEDNR
jgi:hypothetical protein